MKVRVKKLCAEAVIPQYAHATDAGMDLVAVSKKQDEHGNIVYGTGLAFEIPEGYVGLLFPRSSNAKKNLWLTNSVGVIDSGYRGEVMLKFRPSLISIDEDEIGLVEYYHISRGMYEPGERIGQIIIMPYPKIEFEEVEQLSDSDRGEGGYGSTGK